VKRMVWILKPSIRNFSIFQFFNFSISVRLVLQHNAAGVCADSGEQGGNDRDDNLTDALQGVLCGFFHRNIILRVNNELNLNQA